MWKVKAGRWKVKAEMWKLKGCTFDSINSNRSREALPRFCGFVISRLLRVADPDTHWICHIDRMGDISIQCVFEIHWQCLFLASHAVQTTSAQRVTNCYKHVELVSLRIGMTGSRKKSRELLLYYCIKKHWLCRLAQPMLVLLDSSLCHIDRMGDISL